MEAGLVEIMTRGRLLSALQLREAVAQHGPGSEPIDAVEAVNSLRVIVDVVVPLWTLEEGRSDMSLRLQLEEVSPARLDVQVLGLFVPSSFT